MARAVSIDEKTYACMLGYIHSLTNTDCMGVKDDLVFINEDYWLQDTAVIEHVTYSHGSWRISLVFAYYYNPLKLIQRKITSYPSRSKAELSANFMRRLAAKDQRGTLSVNAAHMAINFN